MTGKDQLQLLGTLLGPLAQVPALTQPDAVIGLADRLYLLPTLYLALRRKGALDQLPTHLAEGLEAAYLLNRMRNTALRAQARDLTGLLAEIEIAPVYLKGMAQILGDTYEDPGARMTSDLDVLVPAARLAEAAAHLRAQGFVALSGADDAGDWMRDYAHHAPPLARPDDMACTELHRAFFADETFLLPAADILAAAQPVRLSGWQALVPAPDHQAVMAIAHASLRGLHRFGVQPALRDALDVMALARQDRLKPDRVRACFHKAGVLGAYGWYRAMIDEVFGQQALPWQDDLRWRDRARGRFVCRAWLWPGWQRLFRPGSLPQVALLTVSQRDFRAHVLRLAINGGYRAAWRRNR